MKTTFRKTETYIAYCATIPVELDSKMFPNFKGDTEEDFFKYIYDNIDDWHCDGYSDTNITDDETIKALYELQEGRKKEYGGSYEKGMQQYQLQIGTTTKDQSEAIFTMTRELEF